jgi:hypothetical protein
MSSKIILILTLTVVLGLGLFLTLKNNKEEHREKNGEEVEEFDREATEKIKSILTKGREVESLVYDVTMYKFGEVFSLKFREKGEKMRMDVSFQGRTMINLWNKEENTGYVYTAGDTRATKIEEQQAVDIFYSSVKEWVKEALHYDVIVLRRDFLEEKECLVLNYKKDERKVEMWVLEDLGLPIKITSQEEWGEVEINIENIELIDIPDSVFSLPLNMEVTEELIYF